jgi:hypothetical protein
VLVSLNDLQVTKLQTHVSRDTPEVGIPSVANLEITSYTCSTCAHLETWQTSSLYSKACQVVRNILTFTDAMVSETRFFSPWILFCSGG